MRRSWHHAGNPRRPRRLYRVLAQSPERRQAGDLHRRQPCAKGRRLSARLAVAGGAIMSRPPSSSSTANFTAGRTFSNCGARSWPPPEPRRQANWRCLQPCTTTAARPPSARHRGAICNRACSKIRPLKQGRAAYEQRAPARPLCSI
jgi:hypothetical protein